jgi:hypothetical protein
VPWYAKALALGIGGKAPANRSDATAIPQVAQQAFRRPTIPNPLAPAAKKL